MKNNKMNNKGFSLVELIIVVAIMAVLIGVLAPQYMRYVERTRLQKDNSAISEVANAMKIAAANEAILKEIPTAGLSVTITGGTAVSFTSLSTSAPKMEQELTQTIGSFTATSNTYKGQTVTVTIKIDGNGIPVVEATGWVDNVGDTASTKTF